MSSETYSRWYKKIPNIVIRECLFYRKMNLLIMCGSQIRLCISMFGSIASKQLNSLTTINYLSWLGGSEVTHRFACERSCVQCPVPARDFMFEFVLCCCCVSTLLSKNTPFVTKYCNSFCNVNLFSIFNILQDLWPVLRV